MLPATLLVAVNKIVARLLLDTNGIHVAEIQATCCRQSRVYTRQHVARQHVARTSNMLPGNKTRLNAAEARMITRL